MPGMPRLSRERRREGTKEGVYVSIKANGPSRMEKRKGDWEN